MVDKTCSPILWNATTRDAIFARPLSKDIFESLEEDGLHIRAERQIIVRPINADDGHIWATTLKLALQLREDKMTDTHLDIFNRLNNESDGPLDILSQKMSDNDGFKASLEALS